MRTLTKLAATLAVALPLIGVGVGTAEARDTVTFGVTVGNPYGYAGYGNPYYGDRYDRYHRALPPRVVRTHLSRYYNDVSRLNREGDVYIARAEDRRGRDLWLTVNAYTGEVIDVRYARRDRDRWDDRYDRSNGYR